MKLILGRIVMANGAEIPFELYPQCSPLTVENFVKLVKEGYYDGKTFHRCIPNFVSQGGCPKGDGTGDLGYHLKNEASKSDLKHLEGSMAMARAMHPDSACCQFYICHCPQPHLDGSYTVFGRVTDNMGAVRAMRNGDVMAKIEITEE